MGSPVLYLAVYSDLSESPLLLGAFTAQLALAKQTVLVSAVLVEVGGRLVLPTLTALFLPNRRLGHLHNHQAHLSPDIIVINITCCLVGCQGLPRYVQMRFAVCN